MFRHLHATSDKLDGPNHTVLISPHEFALGMIAFKRNINTLSGNIMCKTTTSVAKNVVLNTL